MNEFKKLILLYGKDRTKDIKQIKLDGDIYKIVFNNSKKIYPYNVNNVVFKEDANIINLSKKEIYYNGQILFDVEKAIKFDEYIKLMYKNGESVVYMYDDISLGNADDSNNVRDVFKYFKEVAKYVQSGNEEKDNSKSKGTFLEKEYDKIDYIDNNSVLGYYLNKRELVKNYPDFDNIIFTFGFNSSQKIAVENVFKSNISIIEGPPGTGKTQTILNIIANLAIMQNKTVAVVSNNNEAVNNVKDKLDKNGYGFIVASLGKRKKGKNFFQIFL